MCISELIQCKKYQLCGSGGQSWDNGLAKATFLPWVRTPFMVEKGLSLNITIFITYDINTLCLCTYLRWLATCFSASLGGYFFGISTTNYCSFWNAGTILFCSQLLPYEEIGAVWFHFVCVHKSPANIAMQLCSMNILLVELRKTTCVCKTT